MDINKIKKRLESFQEQSTQKSNFLWKPPAGKSLVRILPYMHNKETSFVELYFHFNLQKGRPILSPISYGEADPIVEFAAKLKRSGSKEDYLLAKKLEPKQRIFAPVLVRGSEEEGVKVWGFGVTVYKELCEIIADDDFGDISHPTNGRDITIQTITPQEAGNSFGKTKIIVKPKITPLTENADTLKALLTTQPNISDLYKKYSYDELTNMLRAYLNPDASEAEAEKKTTESTKGAKASSSTEDVDDAFNKLFNEK